MSALRISVCTVFTVLLLAGCSGGQKALQSYDVQSGQTKYETQSYTVSTLSGASIASSKSISMRAVGQCTGRDCTPNTVSLVFSTSAQQQLQVSGLGGEVSTSDTQITWSSAEASEGYENVTDEDMMNVIGSFASVDLTVKQLAQIANASSVHGEIGGQSFNLGSGVRSGLQSLLQKMNRQSSD
jgi:hypothetical protein